MWPVYLLALLGTTSAQIPTLGWCPDFQPMANFNMNRFLGTWYEAERYFTVSELGSRCVTTNYLSTPEGRIVVSNEITNSLTGMKRVMEGSLQMIGREGEGRIMVKYSSLPLPYESEFSILDTDYDNYAVMWSCSGIGPVHTQNVWLLSRDRLPSLGVMTQAYNVLDRYKISRTFFVKTNQADCSVLPDPAAVPPIERANNVVEEKSAPVVEKVQVVDPEVKANKLKDVFQPELEESKLMQVPELIMSESEKKEEKMQMPEQMPMKDMKDMPEKKKEEMKTEMKPDMKPEMKPEMKPLMKPEMKPDMKPEMKPEMKPQMKPEMKPMPVTQ